MAAKPTAEPVSAMISKAPAMVRRRNPTGVVRPVIFVVVWIWLVFAEVFMTLIVQPTVAPQ